MAASKTRQEFWQLIYELKTTADRVSAAESRGTYDPEDHVVLRGNVERIIEIAERGKEEVPPPTPTPLPIIGQDPKYPQIGVMSDPVDTKQAWATVHDLVWPQER